MTTTIKIKWECDGPGDWFGGIVSQDESFLPCGNIYRTEDGCWQGDFGNNYASRQEAAKDFAVRLAAKISELTQEGEVKV
jgi:hypothetical protein